MYSLIVFNMVEESVFRGVIEFLADVGIFDVVLPFLLIFTVMFAILEKTRIFGTEDIEGQKYTRKNLNAMTAFVVAFLVIASTQLVALINQALAQVSVIILIMVSFLMLIGIFYKEGEEDILSQGWKTFFMVVLLITVILIFLQAIPMSGGQGFLESFWDYMVENWGTNWVGALIFIIILVILMVVVIREPKRKKGISSGKSE